MRVLKTQSGFTLLELMITLAIAALLAVFAMDDLQNLLPRTRTKSAARQLRGDLQKAKLTAVKRNTECLVDFTVAAGANSGMCRTCISTDNDCNDPGDEIITELNFNDYSNVELQSASFSGSPQFVFNARGISEQVGGGISPGSAVINCTSDAQYSFTLWLSSTGRVRIE